uniref:Multiple C2 domain-containing protein n=1 Tax=Salix viminalis TaxID=40686 RepID=A0A6N2KFX6_SALVM
MGNQPDSAFSVVWHSDAAAVSGESVTKTRSNNPSDCSTGFGTCRQEQETGAYIKLSCPRELVSKDKNPNPTWNEEVMFFAVEPFEDHLILSAEDTIGANKVCDSFAPSGEEIDASSYCFLVDIRGTFLIKYAIVINLAITILIYSLFRCHGGVKNYIHYILSGSFCAWSSVFSKEVETSSTYGYQITHVETAQPDVLDEEFDSFPSSKQGEALKTRYDRLRGISGRLMIIIGELATQLERIHAIVSWRDPGATAMLLISCLIACFVFVHNVHLKYLAIVTGTCAMRLPRLCFGIPSIPQNFLRRLPTKTDSMS